MSSVLLPLAALILASVFLWRVVLGYRQTDSRIRQLCRPEAAFAEACADALFPDDGALPISGRAADLPAYLDGYFGALPRSLRLQLLLLFLLFEHATLLFPPPGGGGRRRFSSLAAGQRVAYLASWEESSLFVRRLAFTALRAAFTMGYLGHPENLRFLRLEPFDFESPTVLADLLYPRIGAGPDSISLTESDLSAGGREGLPLDVTPRLSFPSGLSPSDLAPPGLDRGKAEEGAG